VKKLIGLGLFLLAAACQRKVEVSSPSPSGSAAGQPGAATTTAAITAFMNAAKSEDLQAIGNYWGTAAGPAREQMTRSEFEMRAFYIVKCVRHDSFQVLSETGAAGGRRVANVQIKKGPLTKLSNFTVIPGPGGRWFVENLELEPLTQICTM
jgi:hypothetical protein